MDVFRRTYDGVTPLDEALLLDDFAIGPVEIESPLRRRIEDFCQVSSKALGDLRLDMASAAKLFSCENAFWPWDKAMNDFKYELLTQE